MFEIDWQNWINQYGYWAIFLGVMFEGEIVLFIAAFMAAQGYFNIQYVGAIAFIATIIAIQALYHVGDYQGRTWINQHIIQQSRWQKPISIVSGWLHKHQYILMLGFRFMIGCRAITPLMIGAAGIPALRFTLFNVIGGLIWSIAVTALGFWAGEFMREMLQRFHINPWLMAAGLLIIILMAGWIVYRKIASLNKDDTP
ncbi:MAG: VTT domain-containing protein [Gammaproteobacteria bacterium]|nr:VTT domain-containing protein [Gammaproteobacteria bacterium]